MSADEELRHLNPSHAHVKPAQTAVANTTLFIFAIKTHRPASLDPRLEGLAFSVSKQHKPLAPFGI